MTITRKDRGELLYSPEISKRTGMPAGTIRSKYQRGEMPCVWKLGRWLVAWETDLDSWLDEQRARTVKTRQGSAPTEDIPADQELPSMWEGSDFDSPEEVRGGAAHLDYAEDRARAAREGGRDG